MNITVLYSLPTTYTRNTLYSLTDEDTGYSAKLVASALKKLKHKVKLFALNENDLESLRSIQADCIFNLIEWTGHDLPLARRAFRTLEQLNIPFTGVDSISYINTTNKILMKQLFAQYKIPTPKWQAFYSPTDPVKISFHYPVIIKPAYEHCSVGITPDSLVYSQKKLKEALIYQFKQFEQPILVEEYISGEEFHIPVLEYELSVNILPPTQIIFSNKSQNQILTFYSRWNPGHPDYLSSKLQSVTLSKFEMHKLAQLCIKTFILCGLKDYSRVDLRIKKSVPYVIEINSNPALDLDPEYEFMFSCKTAGLSFTRLIKIILLNCLRRFKSL